MEIPILFVTGMQRSGTTLLEKLLSNHPRLSLLSQPFPLLFVETKRDFLRRFSAAEEPHPLGPLFLEVRYHLAEFGAYLGQWRTEPGALQVLFARMADYSGQYTRFDRAELDPLLDRLTPGDFMATVGQLYRGLSRKPEAAFFGGKETLCEEFLPYLLDRGGRCLMIVRDPRDVLASLDHGRGERYGGRRKPTLFNVRNWRKSIAFALHLESHPGFTWVRYEDLVARPLEVLQEIAGVLGLEPFAEDAFAQGIRDQEGLLWTGNSSHRPLDGITAQEVGTHCNLLPAAVVRYIEAACYPELSLLGYPVSIGREQVQKTLEAFEEPHKIMREEMRSYTDRVIRASEELRRYEALFKPPDSEAHLLFLFEEVQQVLAEAVAEP